MNKKIEQKNKNTGKYDFGSHIVKATGKLNSKGQMLFESQFAYDSQGSQIMTLEEIVKYANENIIDPDDDGKFSEKNIKIYRKNPEIKVYPMKNGPYKSPEGAATEKKLSNDKDVQSEQPLPHADTEN